MKFYTLLLYPERFIGMGKKYNHIDLSHFSSRPQVTDGALILLGIHTVGTQPIHSPINIYVAYMWC